MSPVRGICKVWLVCEVCWFLANVHSLGSICFCTTSFAISSTFYDAPPSLPFPLLLFLNFLYFHRGNKSAAIYLRSLRLQLHPRILPFSFNTLNPPLFNQSEILYLNSSLTLLQYKTHILHVFSYPVLYIVLSQIFICYAKAWHCKVSNPESGHENKHCLALLSHSFLLYTTLLLFLYIFLLPNRHCVPLHPTFISAGSLATVGGDCSVSLLSKTLRR